MPDAATAVIRVHTTTEPHPDLTLSVERVRDPDLSEADQGIRVPDRDSVAARVEPVCLQFLSQIVRTIVLVRFVGAGQGVD